MYDNFYVKFVSMECSNYRFSYTLFGINLRYF